MSLTTDLKNVGAILLRKGKELHNRSSSHISLTTRVMP
jgi:hypothetical protein